MYKQIVVYCTSMYTITFVLENIFPREMDIDFANDTIVNGRRNLLEQYLDVHRLFSKY